MRLRKKIKGTAVCPRMSVYVSNKHMYVQLIDDTEDRTLAAVSTLSGDESSSGITAERAAELGKLIGEKALAVGVQKVVFDRGGFTYGKRINALANAAREVGLKF